MLSSIGSRPGRRALLTTLVLAALSTGAFVGCHEGSGDPRLREPLILFEARALERFLNRTARLEGTPLGSESVELARLVGTCQQVWAHPEPDRDDLLTAPLLSMLSCRDPEANPSKLESFAATRRGGHDGLLLWPVGDRGHIEMRIDVDAQGGLDLESDLTLGDASTIPTLFVPGTEAPAPAIIEASRTLLHLRTRPRDGIRLSNLIETGSQGDARS